MFSSVERHHHVISVRLVRNCRLAKNQKSIVVIRHLTTHCRRRLKQFGRRQIENRRVPSRLMVSFISSTFPLRSSHILHHELHCEVSLALQERPPTSFVLDNAKQGG